MWIHSIEEVQMLQILFASSSKHRWDVNVTVENRNKQTKRYENKMINETEGRDNYYSIPEYIYIFFYQAKQTDCYLSNYMCHATIGNESKGQMGRIIQISSAPVTKCVGLCDT